MVFYYSTFSLYSHHRNRNPQCLQRHPVITKTIINAIIKTIINTIILQAYSKISLENNGHLVCAQHFSSFNLLRRRYSNLLCMLPPTSPNPFCIVYLLCEFAVTCTPSKLHDSHGSQHHLITPLPRENTTVGPDSAKVHRTRSLNTNKHK